MMMKKGTLAFFTIAISLLLATGEIFAQPRGSKAPMGNVESQKT